MAIERNIVSDGGEFKEVKKPRRARTPRVAQDVTPALTGRPSAYTFEIGVEICERISMGESLRKITRDDHIPSLASVMRWLGSTGENYDIFREQYARAKETQAESFEDMMLDVAQSENDVNRARLIIDTMKWTASKLKPKKYGDKIDHTTNGKDLPSPIISIARDTDAI